MIARSILAWLFTAIYWPVVLTVHALTFKRLGHRWTTGEIHIWGRSVLRILGIYLIELNSSPITERQARVVIINHQSALDLVWPAAICSPAPIAIGKKEVIFVPIINLCWWLLDFVRVDRKNHEKALRALSGVADKILSEKRALIVAPEGTRTRDGNVRPFKKGAFRIAQEARIPIYPIVVEGAYQLLPRNAWIPKSGTIRIKYLDPLSVEELEQAQEREALDALIEKTRTRMQVALDELRSGKASEL
jgi:1-acyl-sn-glycerol-3-phosphate acyltransferase